MNKSIKTKVKLKTRQHIDYAMQITNMTKRQTTVYIKKHKKLLTDH